MAPSSLAKPVWRGAKICTRGRALPKFDVTPINAHSSPQPCSTSTASCFSSRASRLWSCWPRPGGAAGLNRAWRLAAFAVLVVTGVAWILQPDTRDSTAGVPGLSSSWRPWSDCERQPSSPRSNVMPLPGGSPALLRFLHPANGLLEQSDLLRALDLAQRGDFASALCASRPIAEQPHECRPAGDCSNFSNPTAIGMACSDGFAANCLLGSSRRILPCSHSICALWARPARGKNFSCEFTTNAKDRGAAPQHVWLTMSVCCRFWLLADACQALSNLLETKLRKLPRDTKEFWIGPANLRPAKQAPAAPDWKSCAALQATPWSELKPRIDSTRGREFAPAAFACRRCAASAHRAKRSTIDRRLRIGNGAAYDSRFDFYRAECRDVRSRSRLLGGSTNPFTLHRLGALEFFAVRFEGEYWRFLTSLFLHYGPLHLLFNLYALFIIGPGLEQAIGSIRFGICYLVSGLGSGLGVLLPAPVRLE